MFKTYQNGGVGRRCEVGFLPFADAKTSAKGQIISETGWGSREQLLKASVGEKGTGIPQLWLCGGKGEFPPVTQRFVVKNASGLRLIQQNGCSVGFRYEDADAEYALLTGILPADVKASRTDQAMSAFEGIESALKQVGMNFSNVARTWLYLDELLDWYDDFNKVRDAFFHSRHVYDGLVPASTGIGSSNLCGSAITVGAIAFRSKKPGVVTCQTLPSPLQCPALHYGSSFSRAVELSSPGYRTVFISGTASTKQDGKVAFVGDIEKQIQCMMEAVEAILVSRKMTLQDTARGILYLKRPEYLPAWEAWKKSRGIEKLPIATVQADICRDNWLVELELDAVAKKA